MPQKKILLDIPISLSVSPIFGMCVTAEPKIIVIAFSDQSKVNFFLKNDFSVR